MNILMNRASFARSSMLANWRGQGPQTDEQRRAMFARMGGGGGGGRNAVPESASSYRFYPENPPQPAKDPRGEIRAENWQDRLRKVMDAAGRIGYVGEPDPGAAGTNFQIAADAYWYIASILTNSAAAPITNAAAMTLIWSNVGANGSLHVNFGASLATNDTPEWWLAQYGWTSNFNAAATNDSDGDGVPAWQEYPADTNPTNRNSVLRMAIDKSGLRWTGGTGVVQYLEESGGLFSNVWKIVSTGLPPTSVSNSAPLPAAAGRGFYRIRAVR